MAENLRQIEKPDSNLLTIGPDAEGIIFDVRKFSIQDGPGIRTAIFFKGCPLDCWWCHNPESQSISSEILFRKNRCQGCGACVENCTQNAIRLLDQKAATDPIQCTLCGRCVAMCFNEAREIAGRRVRATELMGIIREDIVFFDESHGGVTFSGGEPLMQPDFLFSLLNLCKQEEIRTALDTSGYAAWQTMERVIPLVNLFLYDLKFVDDDCHRKYTGVSNRLILENLKKLSQTGADIILRIPLIPGVNDSQKQLADAAQLAASLPRLNHVDLLPYHPSAIAKYDGLNRKYRLADIESLREEKMESAADIFRSYGLTTHTGG